MAVLAKTGYAFDIGWIVWPVAVIRIAETVGTVTQAQSASRRRILRAFVGRGLLKSFEAEEMLAYRHSKFSVNAGTCIEAHDHAHF